MPRGGDGTFLSVFFILKGGVSLTPNRRNFTLLTLNCVVLYAWAMELFNGG